MKKFIALTAVLVSTLFATATIAGESHRHKNVGSSVRNNTIPGHAKLDAVLVSRNGCGKIVSYRGTTPQGSYSVNGKFGVVPVTIEVDTKRNCNSGSNLIRKIIPVSNFIGNKSTHTLKLYFIDTNGRLIKTETLGI